MEFRSYRHSTAANPLVKQSVGHVVPSHLFRGTGLCFEDQRERVGLLALKVQRTGNFEPVSDLPFHRHR